MSYVLATPEMVAAAANNLAQIGSTLSAANAAALAPTTGVLAAGADEVSAAVASLFSGHAQAYQTLGTQAAAFHERFIQALSQAGSTYAVAEAASATPLQNVLDAINAPVQSLTGRPLI
ncbi:PE family protein, partial [Mycobacterium tuberculosis]|uniref:PE family protein n=1 Tax=Mycobacterium tuberculosis TaxID=1773 RepID=UPI0011B96DB6